MTNNHKTKIVFVILDITEFFFKRIPKETCYIHFLFNPYQIIYHSDVLRVI